VQWLVIKTYILDLNEFVRFEVLSSVDKGSWDMALCHRASGSRRFEGLLWLYLKKGVTIFEIIGNHSPDDVVSHHRRRES
jgi:hypothetical protein